MVFGRRTEVIGLLRLLDSVNVVLAVQIHTEEQQNHVPEILDSNGHLFSGKQYFHIVYLGVTR